MSLTINQINNNVIEVMLIPETVQRTCFQFREVGDIVNVEVDMIAKYVERLSNPVN